MITAPPGEKFVYCINRQCDNHVIETACIICTYTNPDVFHFGVLPMTRQLFCKVKIGAVLV